MPEWTRYRVDIPRDADRSDGVGELDAVFHVAHVPVARRIIEDGRVEARLIYDESRLNQSRTTVTWVSANQWVHGSIYGNVEFAFRWSDIVRSRKFYWVEAMHYQPHAYRLLVTSRALSASEHIRSYDPRTDEGPLRYSGGVWYWNSQYTSEFMIDDDLSLDDCHAVEFIPHHDAICRMHGSNCEDRRSSKYQTAARVISHILADGLHSIDHVFEQPSEYDVDRPLSRSIDDAMQGIRSFLKPSEFAEQGRSVDECSALMRGALSLYGADQRRAARELAAMMPSERRFDTALTHIVREHFGISDWDLPP